jgi:hypothetical protein
VGVLIHHVADVVGIVAAGHPVEDDAADDELAAGRLAPGLEVHGRGEALDLADFLAGAAHRLGQAGRDPAGAPAWLSSSSLSAGTRLMSVRSDIFLHPWNRN